MPEGVGDEGPTAQEKMLWLWSNLVGQTVTVTCRDGKVWDGLMEAKDGEGLALVLTLGRQKKGGKAKGTDNINLKKILKIASDDVLHVQCIDASLFTHEVKGVTGTDSFCPSSTDRDLVKWDATTGSNGEELEGALRTTNHTTGEWNQFEANAKMFKYKSSYSEDYYTTRLDKTQFTQEQIDKAERITMEIEGKGGGGNDCEAWADDYDEEAAYAGVTRESDPVSQNQYLAGLAKEGSYIPPHLRKTTMQMAKTGNGSSPSLPQAAEIPNNQPIIDPQYQRDGALQVRADHGAPARIPQDCYRESDGAPAMAVAPQPVATPQSQPAPLNPTQQAAPPVEEPKVSPQTALHALPLHKRSIPNKSILAMRTRMVHDPSRATKARADTSNPQSRAMEIAAFKEESKRFAETFKKKASPAEAAAAAKLEDPAQQPQQQDEDDDGLDTPQKKKLNPAAVPFVMKASDEEDAKPTPPVELVPAPDPIWKVQLSEKAKENKFICKIIADGIYSRIKAKNVQHLPNQPNQQQVPIPGDPSVFTHEWEGDDYYWDEENDSDTEKGAAHFNGSQASYGGPPPPQQQQQQQPMQHQPIPGQPPMGHQEMHHMPHQRPPPPSYPSYQPSGGAQPPWQQPPHNAPYQPWNANPNSQPQQYSQPPQYNQQYQSMPPPPHQQHMGGYQNPTPPPHSAPPMGQPPAMRQQYQYPPQQGGYPQQQPPPQQPPQQPPPQHGQQPMYSQQGAPPHHHDPNMHMQHQGHLPPSSHAGYQPHMQQRPGQPPTQQPMHQPMQQRRPQQVNAGRR
eukprot:TRINITY_DN6565_c0_g1_i2.p1 TRINITY_DN6565_c0_g1~~TRINITY_DN6565_c0_g1_i2.p1  ORF type:complete len:792 (+),score=163.45 TRINITY_DN6565_c0_g1_i2:42-2417(+)